MTAAKYAYVLRTCGADLRSHGGFQWPAKGAVSCPDWDPAARCGGGLHGFLHGEGDGELADWSADAKWLVVKVLVSEVVHLGGKVKFPRGEVVHCGDQDSATTFLLAKVTGRAVVGATVSNKGYGGTATAGYGGTATAGTGGTATAGYGGTATAGTGGTATAGYGGTATAGYGGTATAGTGGTATAGYGGTATAGTDGTATAGYGGTATAGTGGTATAGYGGVITIEFYDVKICRYRRRVAEVDGTEIRAGITYRLTDAGLFVAVAHEREAA